MTSKSEEAQKEKQLGNEAYKKKDFAEAHKHYDRAIELEPTNMALYSNKAATYFEEGNYDACVEQCTKAVEVGREQRADFAQIAKAYARIGNAYTKQGRLEDALVYLQKSIAEHRDPEVVKKHKQLETELKEKQRQAYIDPALSEEEKAKGNGFFKKGEYPNAMRHYNEAISRNPDNAVLYSNRAACYMKLMLYNLAVDDYDTRTKKDPSFIEAYIRKGEALVAMREFARAQKAYEDALRIDPTNQDVMEGLCKCYRDAVWKPEETRELALQDAEVQEILKDPEVNLLLELMSQNPGMRLLLEKMGHDQGIFVKLVKLRNAGVVQMR